MKAKTFNIIILLLIGLTLLAIVIEKYLPEKRLIILPHEDFLLLLYADGDEDGNSTASWVDEHNHHILCDVQAGAKHLFCGFNLLLERELGEGVDLSGYRRVNITLDYTGDASHVTFFLRHYDPQYSVVTDGNSYLFMAVQLRNADIVPELSLDFSEFTLADWWVSSHDIPRELARPKFSNVTVFGMHFAYPGHHEVRLHEVSVSGDWISTENWYLMILWAWMIGALAFTLNRLAYLHRRSMRFQRRINELASLNEELRSDRNKYQQMSQLDELTGVFNRYGFNHAVEQALTDRTSSNIALILIDVDNFKRINDRHGHDAGDRILREIAQIMLANIRAEDTLGRWGGEEFILLCPNTDGHHAYILAEKIRRIIFNTSFEQDDSIFISASFGVGTIEQGDTFEKAFKRVDEALYNAKNEGRNCTIMASAGKERF
jgi:diguanylate cyclase (GGDEF)-like protein